MPSPMTTTLLAAAAVSTSYSDLAALVLVTAAVLLEFMASLSVVPTEPTE